MACNGQMSSSCLNKWLFFSVLSLLAFKSAVVCCSNAVFGLRKATDSSDLLGTCIFATMVIGAKEHSELQVFLIFVDD